jgi:hypothetical protein
LIKHSTALSYLTPQVSTKASKAASASFLVFGHPDFLQRPLGFRLLALRQFVEDVGGFMHPAALAARLGPYLFERLPESKRAISDRELGANREPAPLQIEEQFPPRLRTLAHTVGEADKLLPALGCGSDDDQQALRAVFETGLHMNAVNPEVDVAFGREITLAPARVLFAPSLLEAPNGRGREPAGVPAEQCDQRVLKVAGRDTLEVEDRDQHLQALRPARVGRQNRRRKADAIATFAAAVTHARAAHGDRADAGHDLTLGQMPVAYQSPAAIIGELIGMAAEQARNLGLDRLRQKRSRAVAQNLGQRIAKSSWLRELENISVGHGVSLLCWRSGGVEHPHDTPPYPFTPSPTFAHSSSSIARIRSGTGGGDVAPNPEAARLAFVFGMAATILVIMAWLSSDLAAPNPPPEAIYQPQHLNVY